MKSQTVTVPIELGIEKQTAEACARLVELYANQNGCDLLVHRLPDGRYTLSIKERP